MTEENRISIEVALLNNGGFKNSVRQLCTEKLSFGTAFRLRKLVKEIDDAHKESQQQYLELVKSYALLDEEGNFVPEKFPEDVKQGETVMYKKGDDIPNSFTIPEEKKEDYEKEMERFWKEPVVLDCQKIPVDKFDDIKLSAFDIDMIEPIIHIPDEVMNNIVE